VRKGDRMDYKKLWKGLWDWLDSPENDGVLFNPLEIQKKMEELEKAERDKERG
jgi:hypothetical protein